MHKKEQSLQSETEKIFLSCIKAVQSEVAQRPHQTRKVSPEHHRISSAKATPSKRSGNLFKKREERLSTEYTMGRSFYRHSDKVGILDMFV